MIIFSQCSVKDKTVAVHHSLVLKSECATAPVEAGGKKSSCLVSSFIY